MGDNNGPKQCSARTSPATLGGALCAPDMTFRTRLKSAAVVMAAVRAS